ncbi:sulfur carrier protein ThiS [bacterium]|nr:sulfur carrier protein ThiS [bacterium]
MQLTINGESVTVSDENVSVTSLLKLRNVDMPDMVSVEYNGEILDRSAFDSTVVSDGDQVEFLYFMGGGQ